MWFLRIARSVRSVSATCVLFVCLGNICRSPSAHAVVQAAVHARSLRGRVLVDSAGTGSWHVGQLPHRQARTEGRRRGYVVDHVVRKVTGDDFDDFDLLVAMDHSNRHDLRSLARAAADPDEAAGRIALLRAWDPCAGPDAALDDPYGRPDSAFAEMYDIIERCADPLIDSLVTR
jgi:protein-tyrosine phosphatase